MISIWDFLYDYLLFEPNNHECAGEEDGTNYGFCFRMDLGNNDDIDGVK